jgi:hypothetical protein
VPAFPGARFKREDEHSELLLVEVLEKALAREVMLVE